VLKKNLRPEFDFARASRKTTRITVRVRLTVLVTSCTRMPLGSARSCETKSLMSVPASPSSPLCDRAAIPPATRPSSRSYCPIAICISRRIANAHLVGYGCRSQHVSPSRASTHLTPIGSELHMTRSTHDCGTPSSYLYAGRYRSGSIARRLMRSMRRSWRLPESKLLLRLQLRISF
jgi:hypothetical protein